MNLDDEESLDTVLSGTRFFATLRMTRGKGLRMANQCYYDDLGHHEKPISQQADLLEDKAASK